VWTVYFQKISHQQRGYSFVNYIAVFLVCHILSEFRFRHQTVL